MSERRQPLHDQFRSSDFAQAEGIRRSAASEPPTQHTAVVSEHPPQDTSGSLRRDALQREEMRREELRREELRKHISSAITTRPVAVRPPQIHHQHSYQVVAGPTVILKYCSSCGASWVLVHLARSRFWGTPGWQWEPIHEQ